MLSLHVAVQRDSIPKILGTTGAMHDAVSSCGSAEAVYLKYWAQLEPCMMLSLHVAVQRESIPKILGTTGAMHDAVSSCGSAERQYT